MNRVEQLVGFGGMALGLLCAAPARAVDCDNAGGAELAVLTYNTWGLPRPISVDPRTRFPGIQRLVEETGADIAGLQEVWSGALGLLSLPLIRPDGDGDTGLALVTPHRVEERRSLRFTAESGVDRLKSKGALATRVDLPDAGSTWIVITHMQAGHNDRAAETRSKQVDQLLWMAEDDGRPAMLMGDLNLHANLEIDARTARKLERAGFLDAAVASGRPDATFPKYNERYDRILVRGGAERCLVTRDTEVLQPGTRLSDHLPLTAKIQVGHRGD